MNDEELDTIFKIIGGGRNGGKIDRPLIGYLSPKNQTDLSLFIFDPKNKKDHKRYDITDVLEFAKNLNDFCKQNVGVFILNIFGFNHPKYSHNIMFCRELIHTLSVQCMAFHFVTNEIVTLTSLLIASNIIPSVAKNVLIILVQENELNVVELCGSDVYRISRREQISCEKEDEFDSKKICTDLLKNVAPSKIIIMNMISTSKRDKMLAELKKELPAINLIVHENYKWDARKTIFELTKSCQKWKGRSQFLITVQSCRYFIVGKCNSLKERKFSKNDILMKFDKNVDIPPGDSSYINGTISRSHKKVYIGVLNPDGESAFIIPSLTFTLDSNNCHRYSIDLGINQNNDPSVEPSEHFLLEQIVNLPSTLTSIVKTKSPVIEFFDNSSVICVWDSKKNSYEFAKNWNGVYGRDLFLSFEDETPKLVDKFSTKRSFVIYDILEILATPKGKEIKVDPDWEFKVFKDDGTVLLEYDTHSGSRNALSPNHLMSLLLNEHLKVIKEETSITPKSVGIYITKFSWFTKESEKILKTKFIEIFEEMNVCCEFVEFC